MSRAALASPDTQEAREGGDPRDREVPGQLRALLWLRSREVLGESRDVRRLWLIALALGGWILLVAIGAMLGSSTGVYEPDALLGRVASASWVLWAIVPLLGGGANEVASAQRLAPYPVSSRAVFSASWVGSMFDIPYLSVAPVVLGLSMASASTSATSVFDGMILALAGGLAAVLFITGASGLGQLAAWSGTWVLAGRRMPGLTALLGVALSGAGLLAGPVIVSWASRTGPIQPGQWLPAATEAIATGSGLEWFVWCALLLAPAILARQVGGRLVGGAWAREGQSRGLSPRSWGATGWWSTGSRSRALAFSCAASVLRSPAAQVSLAGVLLIPCSARLAASSAEGSGAIPLGTLTGIAALSIALSIGCNVMGYFGGGATWLVSAPVRRDEILSACALVVGSLVFLGQIAVLLEALVMVETRGSLSDTFALIVARTLLFSGIAIRWAVAHPTSSDFDTLRTRISSPRAVAGFVLMGVLGNFIIGAAESLGGPVAAIALGGAMGLCWVGLARLTLWRRGSEQLALAVRD